MVAPAQALIAMKNRWLLNLAIALVIGGLILVAALKPGSKPPAENPPLTALAPDAVQHIRIQRPKQPDLVLDKQGENWRLTAPRSGRANNFRVDELARLAAVPTTVRFPAVTGELAKFGLDHPLATVFLNDTEIRFGAMHPLQNELYVLCANQVQLVPAAALRTALTPVDDWLSPALLEDKLKLLSLRLPGFSLKQNVQGAWVRTPPVKDLASDTVNRFVDEWRLARALSVTSWSGKPFRERVTITVADGDRSRAIEFGILARKPELVLVRLDEKLEYHFPEESGSRLLELNQEKDSASLTPPTPTAK